MLWCSLIPWAATKGNVTCFRTGMHFSSVILSFILVCRLRSGLLWWIWILHQKNVYRKVYSLISRLLLFFFKALFKALFVCWQCFLLWKCVVFAANTDDTHLLTLTLSKLVMQLCWNIRLNIELVCEWLGHFCLWWWLSLVWQL